MGMRLLRALRVINEVVIAGASGFAEHAHDHFEILTFVLTGSLEHEDSAGNSGTLHDDDITMNPLDGVLRDPRVAENACHEACACSTGQRTSSPGLSERAAVQASGRPTFADVTFTIPEL